MWMRSSGHLKISGMHVFCVMIMYMYRRPYWFRKIIFFGYWLSRIKHTYIIDDPFEDPVQLADLIPDSSPVLKPPAEVSVFTFIRWISADFLISTDQRLQSYPLIIDGYQLKLNSCQLQLLSRLCLEKAELEDSKEDVFSLMF